MIKIGWRGSFSFLHVIATKMPLLMIMYKQHSSRYIEIPFLICYQEILVSNQDEGRL